MTHAEIDSNPVKILWCRDGKEMPGYLVRGSGDNCNYLYVIHNDKSFVGFDAGDKIKSKYGCQFSWQFEGYNPRSEYDFASNRFKIVESGILEFKKPTKFSL